MTKTENFLALYKEYETLLRDKGADCKEVEENSDDMTSNRLRMCRLFRNYLSHQNDPGFLEVSDAQIKFMKSNVEDLTLQDDILKKHIKSVAVGTCTDKDKCCDVVIKMGKLKVENIVVLMTTGFGVASIYDISPAALASKTTKMVSIKFKKNFVIMDPKTKMSDIPKDKIVICTSDGSETGKVLGVLYP